MSACHWCSAPHSSTGGGVSGACRDTLETLCDCFEALTCPQPRLSHKITSWPVTLVSPDSTTNLDVTSQILPGPTC